MARSKVLVDAELVRSLMYLEWRTQWFCDDFEKRIRSIPGGLGAELSVQLSLLKAAAVHLVKIRVNIDAGFETRVFGEPSPDVRHNWMEMARVVPSEKGEE